MDEHTERSVEAWVETLPSANTRSAYRSDLAAYRNWCDARGITLSSSTAASAQQFRSDLLASGWSASTAKRRSSAVNSFLRYQADKPAPAEPVGASPTHELSDEHRDALLAHLGDLDPKGQVLLAMLLLDGLKLDEVLGFDGDDISGRPPRLHVEVSRDELPERLALHPTTAEIVAAHLATNPDGPLLAGHRADGSGLTRFGAAYLLKQAGRIAGLSMTLTSNMLRRSYVTHAHAAGVDLDDIRHRVGHEDVRSTRRYLPRTKADPGQHTMTPIREEH